MDIPVGPQTWIIIGSELGAHARPEMDEADRHTWVKTIVRPALETALVTYAVPHTLARLDDRLAGDDIQWRTIVQQGVTVRFAALAIPAIHHSNGQPLAAIVSASTRKYRRGRTILAHAACRALVEMLGEGDTAPLWIEDQHAEEATSAPKFWLLVWWVGRGPRPPVGPAPVAHLDDLLAHGDHPQVWYRAE